MDVGTLHHTILFLHWVLAFVAFLPKEPFSIQTLSKGTNAFIYFHWALLPIFIITFFFCIACFSDAFVYLFGDVVANKERHLWYCGIRLNEQFELTNFKSCNIHEQGCVKFSGKIWIEKFLKIERLCLNLIFTMLIASPPCAIQHHNLPLSLFRIWSNT